VSQIKDAYKLASDMADQLRAAVDTNPLLRSTGVKLDPAQLFFGAKGKTRISVINFSGLASEAAKQAFVNQLQMALFTWIKANPSESGLLYVMDEAQNFVPSQVGTPCKESAKSLAAQARKYGLGMILATQLPKGIDNGIVSNCTTHVYGRMSSPTAIGAIEELIRAKGGEAHDVGRLSCGEFYFRPKDPLARSRSRRRFASAGTPRTRRRLGRLWKRRENKQVRRTSPESFPDPRSEHFAPAGVSSLWVGTMVCEGHTIGTTKEALTHSGRLKLWITATR
jgi:hypothetical protein